MASVIIYKALVLILLAAGSGSTATVAYYYQGKTSSLTSQVSNLNDQTSSQANQISTLRDKIENLTRQISQLQTTESQLLTVIQELQRQLANGGLCSSGKTLVIGELLDLSSVLSTVGKRARDSSILAINDVNSMLSKAGCSLRFTTTVDDYALDSHVALTELQSLTASGVQVVVGPLNSGAILSILTYANANHIVLISPSSTATVLAIPNDYLFRTVPNDAEQGLANARMLIDSGAKAVIIVQRHDSYGDSLANSTATRFKTLGGQVIADLQYNDFGNTDFTSILNSVQSDFNNNVAMYGAGHIAIYLAGFEEIGQLLVQAKQYPQFPWSTLPWFSTDGVAQDQVITSAPSGAIAAQVKLPSTVYASPNNTKTFDFYSRFDREFPGEGCDSYCTGAYDDVWLAALATIEAGSYDGTKIQAVMPTVASNYYGITGPTELQPSGDRADASFQIWEVVLQGTIPVPTWVLAGSWDSATDSITPHSLPGESSIMVQGAGALFPFILIQTWALAFHNLDPSVVINYNALGSSSGIQLISGQTVDFAASDAPLTDAQLNSIPGLLVIPETLGGVAITYNIPGVPVSTHLNFTSLILVEIYNGTITNWSDPAIQSINPGVTLPSIGISPIHRSDGAGTTYSFTDYLSGVDPWWSTHVGFGTSVNWPPTFGISSGSGNSGVANLVSAISGGLGYVDVFYALQNGLSTGQVRNLSGNFVLPTMQSITYAAANATTIANPNDLRQHIVNAAGVQSYPISAYTYLLVYHEMSANQHTNRDAAYALANFLWWIIGPDGQSKAPALNYALLPSVMVSADQNLLKSLTWNGQPIITS